MNQEYNIQKIVQLYKSTHEADLKELEDIATV